MRFTSKIVLRVAALGVATAAIGLPLTSMTSAHATTAPTLSVSKSISLADGDSITVTGTDFPTGTTVYVAECAGATNCNETPGTGNGDAQIGLTDATTGDFSLSFKVAEGAVGTSGVCGRTTPTQALPSDTQCFIAASTVLTGQDATNTASANIYFNPIVHVTGTAPFKGGQVVTVSGAGFPAGAGQTILIVECSGPEIADCDTSTLVVPQPVETAAGTFSGGKLTIVDGSLGSAGSCTSASKGCIIAATDAYPATIASEGAVPITLAPIPKVATKTAATASGKKVPSTKKFTISGTVKAAGKGVKGLTTELEIKSGSKWKKVSALTTKAGGKFKSGKLKGPKSSAKYEVVTAKQTVGGKTYLASTSKVITVKK
jgi:hypothetical protein